MGVVTLVHNLNKNGWLVLQKLGSHQFLDQALKGGRIKYAGKAYFKNNSGYRNELRLLKNSNCETAGKIGYGIIGSGWRAQFYLRLAGELPDMFEVCGLVTRDEEKGKNFEREWGIKTYRTVDDLLKWSAPDFVVVSVAKQVAAGTITALAERGVPVLAETPPAPDLEQLIELNTLVRQGAKIQVAEQYHLQPLHAARLAVAVTGKLGAINQVQVSVSHGYHAVSLIRKFLEVGFENPEIRAFEYGTSFIAGPGRSGLPEQEQRLNVKQQIALLDFGGKLAVYDFAENQHRSFIRAQRILIRGDRGEITNNEVRYLKDFRTPVELPLLRKNTGEDGNLEGHYLKGILAGEEWVYQNPFIPAKLSDEEIAIAACLQKMNIYCHGGPDFYSLAEASQDQYLALMINQSIQRGEKIIPSTQPWGFGI